MTKNALTSGAQYNLILGSQNTSKANRINRRGLDLVPGAK